MQGVSVLLVEDNKVNQMIFTSMLEQLGCLVDTASNGLEAVSMADRKAYAIIFMDCQMPVMDGYEAAARIRAAEKEHGLAATPIVALTAGSDQDDREKCLQAGMNEYLSKPVSLDVVRAVLDQL